MDRNNNLFFTLVAGRDEYRFSREYVEVVEYVEGERAVLRTKAGYTIIARPHGVEWVPPARPVEAA